MMSAILAQIKDAPHVPRLMLHCCCAPCATTCLEQLKDYFDIYLYYYNPNITDKEEYDKRFYELERLSLQMPTPHSISFLPQRYNPQEFYDAVAGYAHQKEGDRRCRICYLLRMQGAAAYAGRFHFEYFATTLTVSPHKDALAINRIGWALSQKYKVNYLPSDFKKAGGFARSVALSKQYGLYRQDYCGCIYSKKEALQRRKEREKRSVQQNDEQI